MGCSSLHTLQRKEIRNGTRTKNDQEDQYRTINGPIATNWRKFKEVYEVVELLGTGRFGETFRCVHRESNTLHTVKVIRKNCLTTDAVVRSVTRELKTLMSLNYPHILQAKELFEDSKKHYLVMEENTDSLLLEEVITQTQYSESTVNIIMYQIFSAIDYLNNHKINIIDLRPGSIALRINESGLRVRILDYSTENTMNTKLVGCIGRSYYVPPQANDTNFDAWCCGVTMYILLAGYPPFQGTSFEEISHNTHLIKYSLESNPWPMISNQCKSLLRSLLCKDYRRTKIPQAVRHPWFCGDLKGYNYSKNDNLTHVLCAMREFNSYINMINSAESKHISSNISVADFKWVRSMFKKVDSNGDGQLSREELMNEYTKIMTKEEARKEIEIIFNEVDVNFNNFIDYDEFVNVVIEIKRQQSLYKFINTLEEPFPNKYNLVR